MNRDDGVTKDIGGSAMSQLQEPGVDSKELAFEVAIEVLGTGLQPLVRALREEREKARPCAAFIRYCEARIAAIGALQDELTPVDEDVIAHILSPYDAVFTRQPQS